MALLDAYRSALANVGGSGLGETFGPGTQAGILQVQQKKREEERAREREGLTFVLNRAIEEGDEATIMRLGPKVYGAGIDFTAVAQGAKDKKRLADRARDEAEFDRLIRAYSNAADDETKKQLSRAASDVQSRLLGLSPTITREVKDGGLVPSGRKESYTEQVPIVGTGYPAGTIIPFDVARELATPVEKGGAGLVGYFGMAPNAPESRRVLKDIPPVMETVTKDRDIMVPKTEEVPRFDFGSSKTKLTVEQKRNLVKDRIASAETQYKSLSPAAQEAFKEEYLKYTSALFAAQTALFNDEDVALPTAKSFVGETMQAVRERRATSESSARIQRIKEQIKAARERLGILREGLGIQRINAISNAQKAGAAVQNAKTAAASLLERQEQNDFLGQRRVQSDLINIDEQAFKDAQDQADALFPTSDLKYASEEEKAARAAAVKEFVATKAVELAKSRAEKYVTEEAPKWRRSRGTVKEPAKGDRPRGEVKIERVQTRRPPTGGGPGSDAPKPGKNAGAFGG